MDHLEAREIDTMRARVVRMSEVSRRIAESRDLATVLQEVVDATHPLTDARHGAIGLLDDSGQVHNLITSATALEEEPEVEDLPKGQEVTDWLNETYQPLRLADLPRRSRSGRSLRTILLWGPSLAHRSAASASQLARHDADRGRCVVGRSEVHGCTVRG